MCRFAVRAPPAAALPQGEPLKLETPLDLDTLFGNTTEDLDANDLALLALFSGAANQAAPVEPSSGGSTDSSIADAASNTVVLGQALTVPVPQPQPAMAPVMAAAPPMPPAPQPAAALPHNPVQQLQFQAVLQHQASIMQNPQAYPAAAQMYQQALLQQQQQMMVAQQAAVAAAAGLHPAAMAAAPSVAVGGKRGKTQEEVEEQTERIKKRRRESAQRSRQRKNAYMKSLEMENRALKLENERLRLELTKCGGPAAAAAAAIPSAPKASTGSVSRHQRDSCADGDCSDGEHQGSDHLSMSDDEDLCNPLIQHGGGAAEHALGPDPLALLPTADLLHFVF